MLGWALVHCLGGYRLNCFPLRRWVFSGGSFRLRILSAQPKQIRKLVAGLYVRAAIQVAHQINQIAAFIAGATAPPGRRMGHAGAIIGGADDTAEAKKRILAECGIAVSESPADMAATLLTIFKK